MLPYFLNLEIVSLVGDETIEPDERLMRTEKQKQKCDCDKDIYVMC